MIQSVENIRKQFPQLDDKVYGKPLVYLDNAATSLRPICVTEKWRYMSEHCNANLHRAVHRFADLATEEFESTRAEVARFLNADRPEEIIFTSGATNSSNLLAFSFGERFIGEGDEIIVTQAEHHSNIVPWHQLCSRKKAVLKYLHVDGDGHLEIERLDSLITSATRLVCVTHVSNVLGLVNPVRKIADICHAHNIPVAVDGAQGVVHCRPDVKALGCDFYFFSGHKVYAAPGTGVLYGKYELLEQLPPYMGGGEMIETVKQDSVTYAGVPHRFEAGTQNISGVPTLKLALTLKDAMEVNGLPEITAFIYTGLMSNPDIKLYGIPDTQHEKVPLFSFTVRGAHHEDLALILDKMGIAVRSGQMCAEPLMDRMGVTGMLRASFAPYNTMEEAEYFINSLRKAVNMLK